MNKRILKREDLVGVWSAAPSPFTRHGKVDTVAVKRMVEHHAKLHVKRLFLLGTNGEGPWMTDTQRRALVRSVLDAAGGRFVVAVQVTDNSAGRILDNITTAKEDGADAVVIASPFFLANNTPEHILSVYRDAIRNSPLPVGIYDRGRFGSIDVPLHILRQIYFEDNVMFVKDSSHDLAHREMALEVRRKKRHLVLLNGIEIDCVRYLEAGYDGLVFGGAVFDGHMANLIYTAVKAGRIAEANRLQKRMRRIIWDVCGGKSFKCWLAGEKMLLVKMGIFRTNINFLGYDLTRDCGKAIDRVLEKDAEMLIPWKAK